MLQHTLQLTLEFQHSIYQLSYFFVRTGILVHIDDSNAVLNGDSSVELFYCVEVGGFVVSEDVGEEAVVAGKAALDVVEERFDLLVGVGLVENGSFLDGVVDLVEKPG